jgi:hypothetical protein
MNAVLLKPVYGVLPRTTVRNGIEADETETDLINRARSDSITTKIAKVY